MTDVVTSLELVTALGAGGAALVGVGSARRAASLREDAVLRRMVLPADFDPGAVEQFFLGAGHGILRPRYRRLLEGQPWLSVELHGSAAGVDLLVWIPGVVGEAFVAEQLRAAFPGARLEPVDDPLDHTGDAVAGSWVVARGEGLLRTSTPLPGIAALTAGLRGLPDDEHAVFQVQFEPGSPSLQSGVLTRSDQLLRGHEGGGHHVGPTVAERARATRLRDKASRPLFRASIRILAHAHDTAAARRRVGAIAAGLHGLGSGQVHLARRRTYSLSRFERVVRSRARSWAPVPMLLNSEELAAMFGMTATVAREAGLRVGAARQLAPPVELPTRGRVLGVAERPSGERPVAISVTDSFRHLHLVGPTGTGKSELIANLATQDMAAGHGVGLLDFKGDLYDKLLLRVPEQRLDDVVVLDPSDTEWPVGLNVLEVRPGEDPERVCDDLVSTFHGLYAASWGPRTSDVLKACFLTLVRRPGSTLADLPRLLSDPAFRQPYLANLDNPMLEWFWDWWTSLSPAAQADVAASPGNKLRDLLLRGRVSRMLSQSRSTIDLDEILNRPGILLAKLSKGLNGEEETTLLGSLLVARIWQAARRRSAIPEHERVPFFLFIDEFQTVASLTTRFEEVLSTARSLKVSLGLAHQSMSQVSAELRRAITSNARSRVAFQMGADDARLLSRELAPHLGEADLRGLGRFQIACAISVEGNTSRPFTARTVPAPPPIRASADQLIAASRRRNARPRGEVDAEIRRRFMTIPDAPSVERFGRRPVTARVTGRRAQPGDRTAQPGESWTESRDDSLRGST